MLFVGYDYIDDAVILTQFNARLKCFDTAQLSIKEVWTVVVDGPGRKALCCADVQ